MDDFLCGLTPEEFEQEWENAWNEILNEENNLTFIENSDIINI